MRLTLVLAVQVHRQTAASVVQHMALGVAGLGCEDALAQLCVAKHLETSHHVVNAVQGAVDGCRLALGPVTVLKYILQVIPWLWSTMDACSSCSGPNLVCVVPTGVQCDLSYKLRRHATP